MPGLAGVKRGRIKKTQPMTQQKTQGTMDGGMVPKE